MEARKVVDISFNKESQEVSVPILKLTVPKGGNVEYLGLSQKGDSTQMDMTLFIIKSDNDKLDMSKDELFGFMPMSAQRNKYVKFNCDEDDVTSNDICSGLAWKSGDVFNEGTYFLVPWTSGVQWSNPNGNDEQKQDAADASVRYIGLTVHGQYATNNFNIQIVDGMNGKEIN